MIQVKAPGKLYVAGEYAVTEPGYKSVLIAVDRFVTASIEASNAVTGTIHSKTLHYEPVTFNRNEDKIDISDANAASQLKYVVTAIEVFEQYVRSCNAKLKHFHLEIDSNLDEISGAVGNLKRFAIASGEEVETQNRRLDDIHDKAGRLDDKIFRNTQKLKKIN